MKILHTTPAQDGFYMPAEFAPHEGCLMIWPERADSWQYGAYAARKAFIRVIEAISESENMTVLCSEGQYDNARAQLPENVRLVVMATDDAWARDVGPTFVVNGKGERRGIDWGFNAWGGDVDGLYPSWENDNRVARKFCDLLAGTSSSNDDCVLFSIERVHRNNLSLARLHLRGRLYPFGRRGYGARHRGVPALCGPQSRPDKDPDRAGFVRLSGRFQGHLAAARHL